MQEYPWPSSTPNFDSFEALPTFEDRNRRVIPISVRNIRLKGNFRHIFQAIDSKTVNVVLL